MTDIAATPIVPLNTGLADELEKVAAKIRSGDLPATHGFIILDVPTRGEILTHQVGLPARTHERLGLLSFATLRTWEMDQEDV